MARRAQKNSLRKVYSVKINDELMASVKRLSSESKLKLNGKIRELIDKFCTMQKPIQTNSISEAQTIVEKPTTSRSAKGVIQAKQSVDEEISELPRIETQDVGLSPEEINKLLSM